MLAKRGGAGVVGEALERLERGNGLRAEHGARPRSGGRELEPVLPQATPGLEPKSGELLHRLADRRAHARVQLEHGREELGLQALAVEDALRHRGRLERLPVQDEELFLEAYRERRRLAEAVRNHRASLGGLRGGSFAAGAAQPSVVDPSWEGRGWSEARAGSAGLRPVRPLGGGAAGRLAVRLGGLLPERYIHSSLGVPSLDVEAQRIAGILLHDRSRADRRAR